MTSRAFTSPQDANRYYKLQDRAGYADLAPLRYVDLKSSVLWDRTKWFYDVGVGKTVCSTVQAWMLGHHCHIVLVPPILDIAQWVRWLRRVDSDSVLAFKGTVKSSLQRPCRSKASVGW